MKPWYSIIHVIDKLIFYIQITAIGDVMLCSLVDMHCVGETCFIQFLQLEEETAASSEIMTLVHEITQCHIPEDCNTVKPC
jgi:hypothetical protein